MSRTIEALLAGALATGFVNLIEVPESSHWPAIFLLICMLNLREISK